MDKKSKIYLSLIIVLMLITFISYIYLKPSKEVEKQGVFVKKIIQTLYH